MDIQQGKDSTPNASSSEDRGNLYKPLHLQTQSQQPNDMTTRTYTINEVFYSLQGEGVRAGTPNVFIRFTGCNMRCKKGEESSKSPGNFDCDTEFESGRKLTLMQLHELIQTILSQYASAGAFRKLPWLILTGGEPALQVDVEFCDYFHSNGYKLAIETNGSIELPKVLMPTAFGESEEPAEIIDWITVSPKVAEHCIAQRFAHEVKYVRGYGQGIPKTVVEAEHYVISPAFDGTELDKETLKWCIQLVKENPQWRLSVQQHKTTFGKIR